MAFETREQAAQFIRDSLKRCALASAQDQTDGDGTFTVYCSKKDSACGGAPEGDNTCPLPGKMQFYRDEQGNLSGISRDLPWRAQS